MVLLRRMNKQSLLLLVPIIAIVGFGIFSVFNVEPEQPAEQPLGAISTVGGQNYYLYGGGVGSSDTSITLTEFDVPISGANLTMSNFGDIGYVTIEPGSTSRQEFVSFTGITQNADGTATLTGVTRGLMPISPYTASSTFQKAHPGGSVVVISNPPQLYDAAVFAANDESITGTYTFSSTTPPTYDSVPSNHSSGAAVISTAEFASLAYVNQVATSGAADASETVEGIVELATATEAASTTASGTLARLVLPASISTSTGAQSGGPWVVISSAAGKIAQAFIDLTEAFTVTGAWIFNSTATFNDTTTVAATSSFTGPLHTFSNDVRGTESIQLLTASTTITGATTPQPVYVATSTGALQLADADVQTALEFIGFAVTSGTNGQTVYVQTDGTVDGFTGLTAGSNYYVQDAVGTIGTTTGTYEVYVGKAVSTTELLIDKGPRAQMQYMGSVSGTGNLAVPESARFAVISVEVGVQGADDIKGDLWLSRKGKTTAEIRLDSNNSGGGSSTSFQVVYTWSGSTITAGGDDTPSAATAYFYR